ncbi:uncharacterized protein TM35_000152690 [Trypanosoma theileri]|uniref:Uncharacterized protein n=1 Tax=Trypanosoma theileri TaxID=67003 RepID=A0A1X0NWB3_9TRYP|nr:uncharacterized protein TM35_000152690 [Trypanosoma theileri]ORC88838.1 hypothetical protein TM35_000152690 [Trypanosoma theileri]
MLVEVAERLQRVLESAAQHLYNGDHISCSLALLPTAAMDTMPHPWGMADVVKPQQQQQQQSSQVELIVGLSKTIVSDALTRYLFELRKRKEQQTSQLLTTEEKKTGPTLLAPLVPYLTTEIVLLALLFLPSHCTLWNQRRQSLNTFLHSDSVDMHDGQHRRRSILIVLLQELLFTSLLLSFYYKMQEVWVYRWWIVQELLKRGGINVEAFLWHDRLVLQEAADKHLMNYNAWNYRRNVFTRILEMEKNETDVDIEEEEGRGGGRVQQLFLEETNITLRFFETHNADTSAVSYLIFLLQQASTIFSSSYPDVTSDDPLSQWKLFLPFRIWRLLLQASARELTRHCDKGHEAVWVLRLALMQWALQTRPPCGWTLRDELEYIMLFAAAATSVWRDEEEEAKIRDVTWLDVSGSYRWTSFHAARYGLQLLQMVQTAV